MALRVKEDLVKVRNPWKITEKGISCVRLFKVKGLTPGPGMWKQASTAIDSVDSSKRIPAWMAAHPSEGSIYANLIEPDAVLNSRDQAIVKVTYNTPDIGSFAGFPATRIRFYGAGREVQTRFDKDRELLKIEYDYTVPNGVTALFDVATGVKLKATGLLEIIRSENSAPQAALTVIGKIASNSWQGQAPYTWRVASVEFTEVLFPGSTFMVRYVIEYDEDTFLDSFLFTDWRTGRPPPDVNPPPTGTADGNGFIRRYLNKFTNLNSLSLPQVFS